MFIISYLSLLLLLLLFIIVIIIIMIIIIIILIIIINNANKSPTWANEVKSDEIQTSADKRRE